MAEELAVVMTGMAEMTATGALAEEATETEADGALAEETTETEAARALAEEATEICLRSRGGRHRRGRSRLRLLRCTRCTGGHRLLQLGQQ